MLSSQILNLGFIPTKLAIHRSFAAAATTGEIA
jgi:hypothetical protein